MKGYSEIIDAPGVQIRRLHTPSGHCDMFISRLEGNELVEAKSASGHSFVREALAQLLDYARYAPAPLLRVTALFPRRPNDKDPALLDACGVDVVWIQDRQEARIRSGRRFPFLTPEVETVQPTIPAPTSDAARGR